MHSAKWWLKANSEAKLKLQANPTSKANARESVVISKSLSRGDRRKTGQQ